MTISATTIQAIAIQAIAIQALSIPARIGSVVIACRAMGRANETHAVECVRSVSDDGGFDISLSSPLQKMTAVKISGLCLTTLGTVALRNGLQRQARPAGDGGHHVVMAYVATAYIAIGLPWSILGSPAKAGEPAGDGSHRRAVVECRMGGYGEPAGS